MKKIFPLFIIVIFVFSSCSPATAVLEPMAMPTNTVTLPPTETLVPELTSTPTLAPTPTLSPDLNTYECAENVSQADCDFVKEGVRLARYYFLNNFGRDISKGVKFVIINDPNDISYGEGGSAGAHQVTKQGESFIWVNVGLPVWTEFSAPEFQYKNLGLIVHEFTHEWQWQIGCNADSIKGAKQPTSFMIEGYAGYAGRIASGVDLNDYIFSDALALSFWQASQWDENKWFSNSDVNLVVVRHLVEEYGLKTYTQFCDSVGHGIQPNDAFQSAYGMSITDFRTVFKDKVLGTLKDCTVATCGAGVDNYSDKYKLKHLIDKTQKAPNLILNFVDENNKPVTVNHVSLWTQLDENGNFEYAQPFVVPGTLSLALIPGRYIFGFCDPQYPVDQRDDACEWHESQWVDLKKDQVTNLTLQILSPIRKSDLPSPDLVFKINDKDGNPIPNLELQLCNYDTVVKDCNPTYPIRKTDANGVYKDFLRSGKYLIRILDGSGVEVRDIVVDESSFTETSYQFPIPNLIVKFTDVNGSPVPGHFFILCKVVNSIGDCTSPASLWGRGGVTNKKGVFEAQVEPGEYYILTCKAPDCPPPYEIKVTDIVVSETEVTTVEYPLYK